MSKEIEYPKEVIPDEEDKDEEIMNIFYDQIKDQYTVRIPKKFAVAINLNPKKHKVKFKLITPPLKSNKERKILAEVIKK